ncbi:hypothetical protein U1839_02660 [Sphingomonas sp. RT2P30]|uniref:hypothetical protein n=1 Tax=Parasphingomonas halimpatiens TaxID=3096162 RepID=UPI002FC9982F
MRKQVMGLIMVLAIATPTSTITAAAKSPKLARCDGHHRRAANPYGSILPTVDPQTGASTPVGLEQGQGQGRAGVDVFPGKSPAPPKPPKPAGSGDKAEPVVPPISSAQPQRNYESC